MGEPVKILDLARDLVKLAGLDPDVIEYDWIGLRPGERLHETLFYAGEAPERTSHQGILRTRLAVSTPREPELEHYVAQLADAVRDQDEVAARLMLQTAVDGVPTSAARFASVEVNER
jgi:O-antigen biosynthesis protein WbqV